MSALAPTPLSPFLRMALEAIGSLFVGSIFAVLLGILLALMLAPVVFLAAWVFG